MGFLLFCLHMSAKMSNFATCFPKTAFRAVFYIMFQK